MLKLCYIVLIINIVPSAQGFLVFPRNKNVLEIESPVEPVSGDAGDPLFLTPYIQSGRAQQGKKLARVPLTDKLNITSYSGYITVNERYDSNMFFWYFPAMETDPKKAPVLVWLQGGPGVSSMYGLFEENGPLKIEKGKIVKREINWASNHNMIYIDNPVGTGFSFTNDTRGYCSNEAEVGEQLHNMLTQFFQVFSELQENDFFISGESYAGKYVPALGYTIHKKNPTSDVKINLKGLAIGDGWTDPENMLVYDEYLYQIGLIDWNQAQKKKKNEENARQYIKQKQYSKASASIDHILEDITNQVDLYNYLKPSSENYDFGKFGPIMNESYFQKAVHVGNRNFKIIDNTVSDSLSLDQDKSVAPWLSDLLEHYSVMTYNGQLDIIVAYPLTVNYLRKLNFSGAEEYKTARRYQWKVDDELAGFVKQAGRLTEVMVRNAGHMVPLDQPKWALDLITRFTHSKPFH